MWIITLSSRIAHNNQYSGVIWRLIIWPLFSEFKKWNATGKLNGYWKYVHQRVHIQNFKVLRVVEPTSSPPDILSPGHWWKFSNCNLEPWDHHQMNSVRYNMWIWCATLDTLDASCRSWSRWTSRRKRTWTSTCLPRTCSITHMTYQKRCHHIDKFTGTIYKVHIEKDNIMHLYKSTKNMFINTHSILNTLLASQIGHWD